MFTLKTTSPIVGIGNYRLELEVNKVSDYSKEIAQRELRESPENITSGLSKLRSLLKEEPDLIVPLDNDEWLLAMLRLCKFYPNCAKEHIKNYYDFHRRHIENFKISDLKQLKHVFEDNLVFILPKRDQLGRRIVLTRSGIYWDHNKINKDDHFMAMYVAHDLCHLEPNTQINGIITITDCAGLSFEQALKYTPSYAKRLLESYIFGASLHTKELHFINEPQIIHNIFAMIKPLLSKKWRERVHFHGSNMASLHEHVAPACLPQSCGGTMKLELDYGVEMSKFIESFEEGFKDYQKYGWGKTQRSLANKGAFAGNA